MMKFHQVVVSCLLFTWLPTLTRANTDIIKAVVVLEDENPGSQSNVDRLAIKAFNALMMRRALQDSSRTLRGSTQRELALPSWCGDNFCPYGPSMTALCSSLCAGASGYRRMLASFPKDDDQEDNLKDDNFNIGKDKESSNTVMKRRKLSTSIMIGSPCNFQEVTGLAKMNLMADTGIPLSEEPYFTILESFNVIEPNCTTILAS